MGFLTKLNIHKMKKDADNFLYSAQPATVTLRWLEATHGENYDELFKQRVSGDLIEQTLEDVKAEKIVITPVNIDLLEFGAIRVGDVVFRFQRDLDLKKRELVVIHNQVTFYPILFLPDQQELPITPIGD